MEIDIELIKLYDMPVGDDIVSVAVLKRKLFVVTQNAIYLCRIKHIIEDEE